MKKLSGLIIFLFCALYSYCQFPNNQSVSNAQTIYHIKGAVKGDEATMITIKDTLNNPATFYPGAMTVRPQDTINHAIFPIYQSNGIYWSKISSSIFISGLGIDSITLYNGEICQWQGGTRTCWFLTPSTGGSVDSFHLSPDSLAIYQYRNGTFIDSIYLLHTTLYFDRHFGQTYNYGGNPYAQLLSATRLVDSISVTADSVYMITHYADGDVDSTTWIGDGGGGGGGNNTFAGLDDVLLTSLQNNDVAIYKSSSGMWENEASLRFSLAGLQDGDLFEYNSTSGLWENVQPAVQATAWNIVGNAATTAGTNFVGTTDDVNLMFKRNSVVSGLIDSSLLHRTYFGFNTGNYSTANGIDNTGFGYYGLKALTTGYENTAVGAFALQANTTGYENTAIGMGALFSTTTGPVNTAVGYKTLYLNTTGNSNVAYGPYALYNNNGNSNTALGNQALYFNVTGTENVAVGELAIHGNANVTGNTGVGQNALFVVTANNNTAVGWHAGYGITSGSENTAIGYSTISGNNVTGTRNLAMGTSSLTGLKGGTNNTALGTFTLYNNVDGSYNTAIGPQAGQYNGGLPSTNPTEKADYSIFIGSQSRPQADTQTHQIVIGADAAYGVGSHSTTLGDTANKVMVLVGRVVINQSNATILPPVTPAVLDVKSTKGGILFPRMTQAQRDAIDISTAIDSLILVNGSGYTNGVYAISFSGGGGAGAEGTVSVIGGGYTSFTITNYGSGYTSVPSATISAGGGTGGSITVHLPSLEGLTIFCTDCTATDTSTGVIQSRSSSSWRNHY